MRNATERDFGPWVRELFGLDPSVTYLNHGMSLRSSLVRGARAPIAADGSR